MTFIPTAGAVRVDIQYALAGQQVHNVIWCSRASDWTAEQREDLAEAIKDWWDVTMKAYFASAIALNTITVVNQESANAPSSVLVVSPPIAGTPTAGSLPNNASMCVTLRTALRGRNYRGRMYLAGNTNTQIDSSITFVLSTVTNILNGLIALKTAIEALGAVWVVVSKYLNHSPRAAGLKTPITALAADTYIDSQRRRLGLRGV